MVDVEAMLSHAEPGAARGADGGGGGRGSRWYGEVNENAEPRRVITGQERLFVSNAGGGEFVI